MDTLLGFAALAVAVYVAWAAWPVSFWLAVALGGAWALRGLKRASEQRISFGHRLVTSLAGGLRDAVLCVAAGLGLVVLAQVLLQSIDYVVPETVRAWEEGVAEAHRWLAFALSLDFSVLIRTLLILLLLTVLWPRLRPVGRLTQVRKWGGRLLIVLTTVTSFTFFSSVAVATYERDWVAKRRGEFHQAVDAIEKARRELVAVAWIERSVRGLPPETRADLRDLIRRAREQPESAPFLRETAERLARQAPRISIAKDSQRIGASAPDRELGATEDAVERARTWLTSREGTASLPTLRDLRICRAEAERLEVVRAEAETALTEIVKAGLGELVPREWDPLVRTFAKSVMGAVTKTTLGEVFPRRITDLATAASWLMAALGPSASAWRWEVRVPSPPAETASAERATRPWQPGLGERFRPGEGPRPGETFRPRETFRPGKGFRPPPRRPPVRGRP